MAGTIQSRVQCTRLLTSVLARDAECAIQFFGVTVLLSTSGHTVAYNRVEACMALQGWSPSRAQP